MAMQNMYNYKKPTNFYQQIKNVKKDSRPEQESEQPSQQQRNAATDYLEQKIMTAKPEELTLMLYDGILRFLKQAELFMDQKNIEKTNHVLIRAQDILDELNITLNMEYEVSMNLRELYIYMKTRLVEANIRKDTSIIGEVLELATDLRDTWREAMDQVKK